VKLASNENPLGPSPKAMAAARAVLGASKPVNPDGGRTCCGKALRNPAEEFPTERFRRPGIERVIDLRRGVLLRARAAGADFEGTYAYAVYRWRFRGERGELVLVPQREFVV